MTGNTVLLALRVGSADHAAVVRNLTALIGFCAGVVLDAIIHQEKRKSVRSTVTRTLVIEVIIMGTVALLWQFIGKSFEVPLIGLSAIAMGLQSAVGGRIGVSGVSTHTITNTLTRASMGLVSRIRDQRTNGSPSPSVVFLATVWIAYFGGAAVAATLTTSGPDLPFTLPVILLAIVIALAVRTNSLADD